MSVEVGGYCTRGHLIASGDDLRWSGKYAQCRHCKREAANRYYHRKKLGLPSERPGPRPAGPLEKWCLVPVRVGGVWLTCGEPSGPTEICRDHFENVRTLLFGTTNGNDNRSTR